MTVIDFANQYSLSALALPDGGREIKGCYTGDLLSWVMGRAKADDAWITIMSNPNIVAVATLADVACVILAEGVTPEDDVIKTACEKGVNLLKSEEDAFRTALIVGQII
jgi:hypothetical protein